MFLERRDALTDQQAVAIGEHANEPYTTVCEVEYLRGARVQDQLLDVLANELFGADANINRDSVLREQILGIHVLGSTNAGDLGRRMEKRVGNLARDHVDLVPVGQCDDDIRVIGASPVEYFGICSLSVAMR